MSLDFDLDEFVKNPSLEALDDCRVKDLLLIQAHYQIYLAKKASKEQIREAIEEKLKELGVLPKSETTSPVVNLPGQNVPPSDDEDEHKASPGGDAMGSALEEKQEGRRGSGLVSPPGGVEDSQTPPALEEILEDLNSLGLDGAAATKLKLSYTRLQMEREDRARQAEQDAKKLDFEARKLEYEHQLSMRRLELESQTKIQIRKMELENAKASELTSSLFSEGEVGRLIELPPFRETEVDAYFATFERLATVLKWPKEIWTTLMSGKLEGKAQKIWSALPLEDSTNYELVKAAILRAYEHVPESYRQKFREHTTKGASQTWVEFADEKRQLFEKWRLASKATDLESVCELFLLEDFKRCVPERCATYLNGRKVTLLSDAAVQADEFTLNHKAVFVQSPKSGKPVNALTGSGKGDSARTDSKPISTSTKESRECFFCHKKGHVLADCFLAKKKGVNTAKPTGFVKTVSKLDTNGTITEIRDSDDLTFECTVSIAGDPDSKKTIRVFRDTGASQSLIVKGTLPLTDETACGSVIIQGIEMGYLHLPLHEVQVESSLVSGQFKLAVCSALPLPGIDLLMGTDMLGGRIHPVLEVLKHPEMPDPLDDPRDASKVYPACVLTRAQARKRGEQFDLSDTCLATPLASDAVPPESSVNQERVKSVKTEMPAITLQITRDQLIAAQKKDPSLKTCFKSALSPEAVHSEPVAYYVEEGLLMRKWSSPVAAGLDWGVVTQVVVPSPHRQQVLSLAHDSPWAGHLGVSKTYNRILQHFFWPKLKSSVVRYCRSCHGCQVTGKPNQVIPPAPLHPIPAVGEPFSHVIADCVGPLPRSRSGKQYLLTLMCVSTRFPEAIPLRSITTKAVLKALTTFFSYFGFPRTLQTDQGSNFLSRTFKQVLGVLGITHKVSSAYHPQSQGALERWHQTFKSVLRKYCLESGNSWDEGVPFALFALRESVQESLGFSPAELIFAHTVRGPLQVLKEQLMSTDCSTRATNVLEYVSRFRERLHQACAIAKEALSSSQSSMKKRYDKSAVARSFEVGDQVLVLLPIQGSALSARFSGPYAIEEKLSETDYVIRTPDRRRQSRVCHVNMLKFYHARPQQEEKSSPAVVLPVSVVCSSANDDDGLVLRNAPQQCARLPNSEMLADLPTHLSHLSDEQAVDIAQLIGKYPMLFGDTPSQTTVIEHDIDVKDSAPIRQHPYRVNATKREIMKKEVNYLLDNNLACASSSPWSSPCLLVPKPDGTSRFCTDFRKVNAVTVPDSYPLPRMEDCIDNIGSARFVSKLDLLKGYWQVPLTARASTISAFVTPDDFLQYNVLAFGMRNAPATFQRLVNTVLAGVPYCNAYLDDLVVYTSTWEEHMSSLKMVFDRLAEASLTVNLAKCEFAKATVTYLGKQVGQGTVRALDDKVKAIAEFPVPATRRELRRFIGMAGYYRSFCRNFSSVIAPLTSLLSTERQFKWSPECQHAFESAKALLSSAPVLAAPDFSLPFKLEVDASAMGAGAVLLQESSSGFDHPVCFFSKKFTKAQLNYSTIEKEALALLWALQHFEVYVGSSSVPVLVYTDHNPLVFLQRMYNQNQRLMRWALVIQNYNLDIQHKKGVDNVMADALSRVH